MIEWRGPDIDDLEEFESICQLVGDLRNEMGDREILRALFRENSVVGDLSFFPEKDSGASVMPILDILKMQLPEAGQLCLRNDWGCPRVIQQLHRILLDYSEGLPNEKGNNDLFYAVRRIYKEVMDCFPDLEPIWPLELRDMRSAIKELPFIDLETAEDARAKQQMAERIKRTPEFQIAKQKGFVDEKLVWRGSLVKLCGFLMDTNLIHDKVTLEEQWKMVDKLFTWKGEKVTAEKLGNNKRNAIPNNFKDKTMVD